MIFLLRNIIINILVKMVDKLSLVETFKQTLRYSKVEKGYFILLLTTFMPLTYKLISPFMIIAGYGAYTVYISSVLYFLGIFFSFPLIKSSVRLSDILVFISFGLIFYFSQLWHPRSTSFINDNFFDIMTQFAPFFFLGLMVDYIRDRLLIRNVMRMAFLIVIFWELCLVLGLVDMGESSSQNLGEQMDLSYYTLVIISYFLVEYNKSNCRIEFVFLLIGSFLLFLMGTRGPIVIWLCFILTYYLLVHRFNKYNFLKKIGFIFLFLIFYIFSVEICLLLSSVAFQLGFSTKIFDSILGGNMVNLEQSSGRDSIYSDMLTAIFSDFSGFGYGFGGDRLFSASKGYAHNFELEILVQFGLVGGSVIFLFLLILFFLTYRKVKETVNVEFWLVIFFWGFMSLQFSKSWLMHPGFFFLIGYCISVLRTAKYNF